VLYYVRILFIVSPLRGVGGMGWRDGLLESGGSVFFAFVGFAFGFRTTFGRRGSETGKPSEVPSDNTKVQVFPRWPLSFVRKSQIVWCHVGSSSMCVNPCSLHCRRIGGTLCPPEVSAFEMDRASNEKCLEVSLCDGGRIFIVVSVVIVVFVALFIVVRLISSLSYCNCRHCLARPLSVVRVVRPRWRVSSSGVSVREAFFRNPGSGFRVEGAGGRRIERIERIGGLV